MNALTAVGWPLGAPGVASQSVASMSQPAAKLDSTSKRRPPLTVTLSDAGASLSPSSASIQIDTPKTRRVARFSVAEVRAALCSSPVTGLDASANNWCENACWVWQRKRALDICCSCVDDAYHARDGPALQHAVYFRATHYKVLKRALCLKGTLPTCICNDGNVITHEFDKCCRHADDPRTPQDMAETSEDDSAQSGAEQDLAGNCTGLH